MLNAGIPIEQVGGRPAEHHYFVNRGLVSLVKTMRDGRTVEIGTVGVEGVSSPVALIGVNMASLDAVVQVPGTAFRISHEALKKAMAGDRRRRRSPSTPARQRSLMSMNPIQPANEWTQHA